MRNHLILAAIVILTFIVVPRSIAQTTSVSVSDALDNPQVLTGHTVNLIGGLVTMKQEVTTHGVLHTILYITVPEQIFSAVQDKPTKYIMVAIVGRTSVQELSIIDIRNTELGNVVNGKQATFYNMIGGKIVIRK